MSAIIYRKSIICTAFYPFNNRSVNSSMEAIKNLQNVQKVYLDVSINKTPNEVIDILKEEPDVLILTGEAGSRDYVSIEYVAINHYHATIPDNDGVVITNSKIKEDGNLAYFSNIDVYELCDHLQKLGFNIRVSLSAGSYICNLSYYVALNYVNEHKLKTKVIFVHFPIIENDNEEIMKNIVSFLS